MGTRRWVDVPPAQRVTAADYAANVPRWLSPDLAAAWIARRKRLLDHPRCAAAAETPSRWPKTSGVPTGTLYGPCANKVRRGQTYCAWHGGTPLTPLPRRPAAHAGALRYKLTRAESRRRRVEAHIAKLMTMVAELDGRIARLRADITAGQRGLQRRDAPLPGVPANRPLGGGL